MKPLDAGNHNPTCYYTVAILSSAGMLPRDALDHWAGGTGVKSALLGSALKTVRVENPLTSYLAGY